MKTTFKQKTPWFTFLITVIFVVDFFIFHSYTNVSTAESTQDIFSDFGAPYAIQIYQGQYWGLFLNRFLHPTIYLLLLNSCAFLILGYLLERRIGWFRFFLLLLFSTISTSLIQLTLSNDAGIGFSTVNFFLFAYIYATTFVLRPIFLPYKHLFALASFGLLFYLYSLNKISNQFGVEGMVAGWFGGFVLGIFAVKKKTQFILSFLILISAGATLFYAPWSSEWNYSKGYQFHLENDFKNAKIAYRKALEIDANHQASKENLHLIAIDELKERALSAHDNGDYVNARKLYNELLLIDPDNFWAKENLNKLP